MVYAIINGTLADVEKKMTTMEWKEVYPEQSDWKKQIDIMAMAYYGSQKIGSIILYDDERSWH